MAMEARPPTKAVLAYFLDWWLPLSSLADSLLSCTGAFWGKILEGVSGVSFWEAASMIWSAKDISPSSNAFLAFELLPDVTEALAMLFLPDNLR